MSDPTKYTPSYNFSSFQAQAPADPLPGTQVDIQFQAVKTAVDSTVDAIKSVRRSDGALKNGIVTADSLASSLVIGFTLRGAWAADLDYLAGDGVIYDEIFYKSRLTHTSAAGTRPDLDDDTWEFLTSVAAIAITDGSVIPAKLASGQEDAFLAKIGVWAKLGALIAGGTGKTTPADADAIPLSDAADTSATKKLTWANLKSFFVSSLVAGDGISVNSTDPAAPEVSVVPFTGDSGSGGALGGVPAPSSGDAAANKFLKADGNWAKTGGGGGDNPMLNPDHEICQNPTSVAAAADSTELTDRWVYNKTGAVVHTVSRDTDAPTIAQQFSAGVEHPRLLQYSFRATLTTPDDSIAAGDHVVLVQKLEGSRFRTFAQQARKGRCWFKTTITGTFSISLRNGASDLGACVEITMNSANTWELKEFDLPATPAAGAWVYDNSGCGLRVGIVLVAGSTFQVAAYDTWYSSPGAHAVAGQTNFCGTGSTEFRFTGFEIFDEAQGPCASRYLEEEIQLCRRLRRRFTGMIAGTKVLLGVSSSASSGEFVIEGMREVTTVTESGAVLREEGVGTSGIASISIHDAAEGLAHITANCGGGLTTDRPLAIALTGTSDYLDIASVF